MLESRKGTEIHELAIEPVQQRESWRERFTRLKTPPLYTGNWIDYESDDPDYVPEYPAAAQLLDALLEEEPDNEAAKFIYDLLRLDSWHVHTKNRWRWALGSDSYYASDQLLAAILERRLGLPEADTHLRELRASAFYDNSRSHWVREEREDPVPVLSRLARLSKDQFLGVIAADCDAEESRRRYEELMRVGFYDANQRRWYGAINVARVDVTGNVYPYPATTQLLAILVQSRFDPAEARRRFEEVRDQYFSKELDRWLEFAYEEDSLESELELTALLVEKELEKHMGLERNEARRTIPNVLDIN